MVGTVNKQNRMSWEKYYRKKLGDHGRLLKNTIYQAKSGVEVHVKKKKYYLLIHFVSTYKMKLYFHNSFKLEIELSFVSL